MRWFRPRDLLDQTFAVGIILKGLDWLLIVGRRHLEQVLRVCVRHYNQHHCP